MPTNIKQKTILLVEDNEYDRFLTKRALAKVGLADRLVTAKDGAEALNYLFDHGTNNGADSPGLPDVVLLDLKLPRVDGLEVLKEIRANEKTRLLPVLIVTSSDEKADITKASQLGATSYNIKPIDAAKYAEMVQKLVTKYLGQK